jgi:kumamolisin
LESSQNEPRRYFGFRVRSPKAITKTVINLQKDIPMTLPVRKFVAAACFLGVTVLLGPAARAAVPFPSADTPKPADRGLLRELAGGSEITVTVALRLRDPEGAEALLRAVATPGDPQFHKFITPTQFLAKFGPAEADAGKVTAVLQRYGLHIERTSSLTLHATGTPANLEKAFGVSLHLYDVAAKGAAPAYSFHAPIGTPAVPGDAAGLVSAVAGLDSKPRFRPLNQRALEALRGEQIREPNGSTALPDPYGYLTVKDFAQYYDVQPLYKSVSGSGRTIGIVTLANFTPSDALTYWNVVGLTVDPGRITIVNVDGGPGAPSDASGSDETTLDVEQSGGLAPGAKIIVYMAPNTNQGFLDAFAAAVDANTADSLSTSWGEWEWFENLENAPVTDPSTGKTVSFLQAAHELFVQAGNLGQSLFAAAGDSGAYDVSGEAPGYSTPLSVDYPASDPAITAAGGTTLPAKLAFEIPGKTKPFVVDIPEERVWGWDYLENFCKALGKTNCANDFPGGLYPVGGGGGVSVLWSISLASYQTGVRGIKTSQPGQAFVDETTKQILYELPARYAGRNVPDVSANADPITGYILGYTPSDANADFPGFGCTTGQYCSIPGYGGTSFVAPQLNGVTALLGQNANGRLGLLNIPLYQLLLSKLDTTKAGSPLHPITEGDNWFYKGANGYSPAAGVGVIDAAKLATEPGFKN